jgi:hypothetical protein
LKGLYIGWLFPIFHGRTTMETPSRAFRCGAIHPRLA